MLLHAALAAAIAVDSRSVVTDHPPTVAHQKEAGGGYAKGSPLHAKQEAVKKAAGPELLPPVSTTMACVINLTIQYFVIYSALAVLRTVNQFTASRRLKSAEATVSAATSTANFIPMLAVLFMGTRMRALQLSQGEPDKYDLPQPFVKVGMNMASYAVLVQLAIVLVLPVLIGRVPATGADGTPEIQVGTGFTGKCLYVTRWVAIGLLYGGAAMVCVGVFTMDAPKELQVLWQGGAPPVSPAVGCTINLALQYFAIYLAIAAVQTYEELIIQQATQRTTTIAEVLQLATNTVNFAPMLCILFIGARMRALQIDPVNGSPQPWAQNCFYLCTYAVLLQLILVIAVPLLLGGKVHLGASEGDITFTFDRASPAVLYTMTAVRYLVTLALYGGFTAVIYSIFVIENPNGPTPPISSAMQCVMNLTVQFFFVYLVLAILLSVKDLTTDARDVTRGPASGLTNAIRTFEAAKGTVQFCPMLAVLFIGLRLRALQITRQKGAPQGFAQEAMFLCTYSVLIQMLMVLLTPLFLGAPPEVDEDGNVKSAPQSKALAYVTVTIRYLCLLMLYGGAVSIVVALFTITRENANGEGHLFPFFSVPKPVSPDSLSSGYTGLDANA